MYPYYCTTYPDKWTEIYVDKRYFDIDPVIDVVRWGFFPVDWSSLDRRSAQVYRLFMEARSYDIGPHDGEEGKALPGERRYDRIKRQIRIGKPRHGGLHDREIDEDIV